MRAVGPVPGGADGLIDAMIAAVGPHGHLVSLICGPEDAPFDPRRSPAWDELGVLAEVFRRRPEVVLNRHPIARMGAIGPRAADLVADPPRDDYYGPGSPLSRIWAANGRVLRLGADEDTVTMLHWAEYRCVLADKRRVTRSQACVGPDGAVHVQRISCLDDENGLVDRPDGDDCFAEILRGYLATGRARRGLVGGAEADLLDAQDLVSFGVDWLEAHLGPLAQAAARARP